MSYDGLRALVDVSLEVGDGEFVTIVGPNGAGKSTLLKAISGTVPAEGGRIAYRGRDIGALRGRASAPPSASPTSPRAGASSRRSA